MGKVAEQGGGGGEVVSWDGGKKCEGVEVARWKSWEDSEVARLESWGGGRSEVASWER